MFALSGLRNEAYCFGNFTFTQYWLLFSFLGVLFGFLCYFFCIRFLLLQCWSLLVCGTVVLHLSSVDRTLNALFFLCLCNFSTC